jgi:hypothetical protein
MNSLNIDSSDSETPSNEGMDALSSASACSQKRAGSRRDYTKAETNETPLSQSTNDTPSPTQTKTTNHLPTALETDRPKRSTRHESAELEPAVQMAQHAMTIAQGGGSGGKAKRNKYTGDGKPRPRPNVMVDAFIHEFGPVLGDRNQKGSITATLRTAQASGLESDIDLLMCLVRVYVVARDTREVRPAHRHPDGDNRMPIYFAMFRTFAEAWAADNFHYTEEDLIADIAADERLLNWVRERGLQPEVPDHPAMAEGEELVETTIMQDSGQEVTDTMDSVAEASSSEEDEESQSVRTGGILTTRRIRTIEEKEMRQIYARKVRTALRNKGVNGMLGALVEHEHPCGCPLFWDTEHNSGWRWKCAHCQPSSGWNEEVRALIGSILEY